MKILCFGSLNIDYVYSVDHFVSKGETLTSKRLQVYSGGKGLNQAVAAACAGAEVWMAGGIGEDGTFLLDTLMAQGVNVQYVQVNPNVRTGNAIIQTDEHGDNCILLYAGANRAIDNGHIDRVLSSMQSGDILLLQNEINGLPYLIRKAHEIGMKIVLNPSPMDAVIQTLPLELVDTFILNEVEARQLCGVSGSDFEAMLSIMGDRFTNAEIVLTLGSEGSLYRQGNVHYKQMSYPISVVDTTAAGDTFTGFYLSSLCRNLPVENALDIASRASAIACTIAGAAPSIPSWEEVLRFNFN